MPRAAPKTDVLRALFARSGNRCSFPGCPSVLVNERNLFVGQVCHIEAAEPGGERFNPTQSDEDRRAYENLLLLCYPHHVETNDVAMYTAERMRQIKADHERTFGQNPFKIDESLLYKVAQEMADYWQQVDDLHREHHVVSDLAIPIDAKASFTALAAHANVLLSDLQQIQESLIHTDEDAGRIISQLMMDNGPLSEDDERCMQRYRHIGAGGWEMLNLGMTNTITKLGVVIVQMEVKYLEEFVKLNPTDRQARRRLDEAKKELSELAQHAGYVD
jgi:hypothetical protein